MAIDNVLTISTNELFRDDPYLTIGANVVRNGNMEQTANTWLGKLDGVAYPGILGGSNIAEVFASPYDSNKKYMEIYQTFPFAQTADHQVYFRWSARMFNRVNYTGATGYFGTAFYLDSASPTVTYNSFPFRANGTAYPGVNDWWVDFDYIYTVPTDKSDFLFRMYGDLGTAAIADWFTNLRRVGGIDLTLIYGAGNEPTIEESRVLYDDIYETPTTITIEDTIKNNILADYANGIVTASQEELACLDVYDINGNKVLDFSKGGLLKVGDIVRIDKDNNGNSLLKKPNGEPRYFQIVERTFKNSGVPLLSLKYREVI